VNTLANTEQFVYRDLDCIQSRIICTTITVPGHQIRLFCCRLCTYFSEYRSICVLGLGLDLVADHFYYDYCTGTPDLIFVVDCVHTLADTERFVYRDLDWIRSWIIFTMITVPGHRIGFCCGLCANFSGYRTICVLGLGLDLVADHFYYDYCTRTADLIILKQIRGSCEYFSGYRTICVSGLGLDLVADHLYYNYCTGTSD
jgi:hypothetical protein